ncbi:MAG: tetratricopeptide repeat protein [Negativicutes bacterium]|nr:tetratricopeptide repeat protein [Negativicutes bacterium]
MKNPVISQHYSLTGRDSVLGGYQYQNAFRLLSAGNTSAAEREYERLLRAHSEVKIILNDLGVAAFSRNDTKTAEEYYRAALLFDPNYAIARMNYGNCLSAMERWEEALAQYEAALSLIEDKSWHNNVTFQMLNALYRLGRIERVTEIWQWLLARYPDDVGILHNYANHLSSERRQYGKAIEIYRRLENMPNVQLATLYNDWAVAVKHYSDYRQGNELYERALSLEPGRLDVLSNLLYDTLFPDSLSNEQVFAQHLRYEKACDIPNMPRFDHSCRQKNEKIRVGFLSADFRYHSVAMFTLNLFLHHDRERLELYCYSNCPQKDEYTGIFKAHCAGWKDVYNLHPREVARLIFDDGIDVLIELSGHTRGNILPVMISKPAPVQMTWLGYVHSLGISAVDYYITDATADPPGLTEHQFVEKLLRLPGCFLCYRPHDDLPPVAATPALANGWVTFAVVGNYAKVNRGMIKNYCDVLRAVPGSKLLIKSGTLDDGVGKRRVLADFMAEGLPAERFILRGRHEEAGDYLRSFAEMDIMLDFYPFNGETITCAGLSMGVPVVSMYGDNHRSRAGLSILTALGKPEWAARDSREFVAVAAGLASDIERLNSERLSLRGKFLASPLCDGPGFARNFTDAIERCLQGRENGRSAGNGGSPPV